MIREGLVIKGCKSRAISISIKCDTLELFYFNISILKSTHRYRILSVVNVLNKL